MDRPRFIIDTEIASDHQYERIRTIEGRIFAQPQAFKTAIEAITVGHEIERKMPQDSWAAEQVNEPNVPEITAARMLIEEYLEDEYNKVIELDEQSETAIDQDETYQQLARILPLQAGNHNKAVVRQKISRCILGIFVERVIGWEKSDQNEPEPLPEAS